MAEVCSICKGTGIRPVPDDDLTVRQCVCAYARALKKHLGPEIAGAATLTVSPLMNPGKVDRTDEDLFLTGHWPAVLPHLKWALGCKGPAFPFRIVTDERIKTVWVGAEDYRARNKRRRDNMETFNSLSDLVVDGVELLIIRLGFMGYSNRAMAGVLKETLMLRSAALKPTWIVDNPESPFGPGHIAWNDDVSDYIHNRFDRVVIGLVKTAPRVVIPEIDENGDVSVDGPAPATEPEEPSPPRRHSPPPRRPREEPASKGSSSLDDMMSQIAGDGGQRRKGRR